MAPSLKRLGKHEHAGRARAFVFIVDTTRMVRGGGDWHASFLQQLHRLFVHAHHRKPRVIRLRVCLQHVFHARDKFAVGFRGDDPVLNLARRHAIFKQRSDKKLMHNMADGWYDRRQTYPRLGGDRSCHPVGPTTRSLHTLNYMSRSGGAGCAGASFPCAIIAIAACSLSMAPCMSSVSWPIVLNGCAQPTPGPSVRKPRRPWLCPGGYWAGMWCVGWGSGAWPATGRSGRSGRSWSTPTRFTCLTMPLSATSAATNRCWPHASTTRPSWRPRMPMWTL